MEDTSDKEILEMDAFFNKCHYEKYSKYTKDELIQFIDDIEMQNACHEGTISYLEDETKRLIGLLIKNNIDHKDYTFADDEIYFYCSFCRKHKDEVDRLVIGPNHVYICNECIYDIDQQLINS